MLVQQIAAYLWRQRRLLMFENRAAFRSRDDRVYRELNQPQRGMAPLYVMDGKIAEADEVTQQAQLGLDLPSERDTMRLVRCEGSITRSLRNALAQLRAMQQARRASDSETAAIRSRHKDRPVVADVRGTKRNRGPEGLCVPTRIARDIHADKLDFQQAQRERRDAEEAARREGGVSTRNNQTKPNYPEDPRAAEKHERLMETAESVVNLSESLLSKRPPSRD